MAILWCGGEDIDFKALSIYGTSTSSSNMRSGYARLSLNIQTGAPQFGVSNPFPSGNVLSAWLSFRIKVAMMDANIRLCGLGSSSYTSRGIFVASSSTTTKLALKKYDGTTLTELAAEAGTSLTKTGIHKIDMQIIDYGDSATVNVYCNGNLVITYTGDITVSGISSLDCVQLGNSALVTSYYLSEIIVSDTDSRNMSLVTNYPSAAGDSNSWTGGYTDIDETTINDADVVYDNTVGHQALFGLSDLPAGSFSVLAVKEAIRACKSSDSTPTSINLGVKSGGTVNVNDNHSLSTSWETKERYMSTNPVTGNPFTTSEVDSLQLALEAAA